jgi:hypothetical protein
MGMNLANADFQEAIHNHPLSQGLITTKQKRKIRHDIARCHHANGIMEER